MLLWSRVNRTSAPTLLALIAVLFLSSATLYAQSPPIAVDGQVFNGSAGGGSVAGLTITLHLDGATAHDHMDTILDEEGRFRFEDISFDPNLSHGVSVRYQDALYGVDVDLSSGSPLPIALTVYESSDDESVIQATSVSVLFASIDIPSQSIAALEIVNIVNNTDRTYVAGPDPMKLLRFGLPPEAHDLQVDTRLVGADFVQVDRGFALLASVPPGEHELLYSYRFPYSENEETYQKSLLYGATDFRVLAPFEVLKLGSLNLGAPQSIIIGEREYQVIEAANLEPGTQVSLILGNLPSASLSETIGNRVDAVRFEYLAPVLLTLLMVSLVGFALIRRSKPSTQTEALHLSSADENQQQRVISDMLADLERSYQAGDLTEEEYSRRMEVLRSRHPSSDQG